MKVTLEGLEDVQKRLGKATAKRVLASALNEFAEEAKARAAVYPPAGEWNAKKAYPGRWYQRHFGPRWARKDGSIGGRDTSEQMQLRWKVVKTGDALKVILGNTATYSPFVVGEEQADFHARHGWKKTSDVVASMGDRWREITANEILKSLGD